MTISHLIFKVKISEKVKEGNICGISKFSQFFCHSTFPNTRCGL